jgi:iron complex outermembrane recepter protein
MRASRSRAWLLSFSALAGAMALGAPAFAMEAATDTAAATAADAQPPETANTKVDEVVVTGALRTQRLQDAPMAVTAVSAQEFTAAGYKSPIDLQFLSPSVQVSVQGANAIYIRGSGTNNTNGSGEQSVGLVIDGVLIGFTDDIGGDISDLDHTEVYRGPQGTQFAMNTSAGAVAILTKKPVIGLWSTDLHLTYGEHDDSADYITQNLPINDTAALRLTASFQHRDGVFENTSTGLEEGGRQQAAARGKFLWTPTSNFTALINTDVRKTDEFPNFPQAWGACGPGITEPFKTIFGSNILPGCNGALIGAIGSPGSGLNVNPDNANSVEDQKAYRHTMTGGGSLTMNYMLGDYTLTSITAYRFMSRRLHGPIGSGYYSAFWLDDWYNGGQTSQEFRIASPADKKLTYVAGLFYYERNTLEKSLFAGSNYGMAQDFYPNTPYGQNVEISFDGGKDRTHDDNKSYAAYTDGSYHITDQLLINAGGRVTRDDIYASTQTVAVPGVYPAFGATKAPGQLEIYNTGYTWRLGPQYFITPDIQLYGTWAHGYKGPLIDASVATLNPVKPEENMMLEGGIKSSWFDHRLTVDLTMFHEKYTNYQVSVLNQSVTPNVFQLGNAGGMLAQGGELEITARPVSDWRLQAGLSVDDNHYTDFKTSCWSNLEPIKQATSTSTAALNGTCITANGASYTQAAGTPLVNSSKYTYRLGATYNHELAEKWKVDANATWLWRSSWLSTPMDPNFINPGYGILNLDAGVTSPQGYRLGVFARNALNTFFVAGRQAGNGGYTNVLNTEAVRTVGVSLDMKFQ